MPAKVQIDFIGDSDDFIADAKKVQAEMNNFESRLKAAGVSQTAYNRTVEQHRKVAEAAAKANHSNRMSLTDLKSAIDLASMALQKLKQGYEFAKEGAQLEFTIQKFDRLAVTIGTTGDVLRTKLMTATRGTMSEMEAMATATDLVSLGLVRTEEDTVRLATVVSGLGMDMNQLVLALSNQTTMRFDQLGLAVVGFDEKVKKLKATGMDANQAFTEAFLQQAEAQLKKVGNAADTTLGQFQKFEAQLKDIKDETKMWVAELAGPLVGAMATNITAHRDFTDTLKELNPELHKQYMWTQTITPEMQKLVYEHQNDERIVAAYTERMNALADAYKSANTETITATLTAEQISQKHEQFIGVLGNVGTALTTYQQGLADANAALESGKIKADEHKTKVAELAAQYQEARNQIVLSIVEMKLATDGWTDTELNAYLQVGKQLGVFSADQINVAKGAVAMADKLIATEQPFLHAGNRAQEAGLMLDSFGDSAEGMTEAAMEAAGGASALKSSLAKLPPSGASWEYNFQINVHGRVPNMPNHGESNLNAGVGYQSGQQQGGEVYAGVPTRVGEAGWESFMPARDGRILGHAESLRALAMGGGGGSGAKFGPFYGNVTLQISEDGASGIMGIR